jgi:RNA-directed DNA polymerase
MSGTRQKIQGELAFPTGRRSEAPRPVGEGTEPPTATRAPERPANTDRLMEEVVERANLTAALHRVKGNKRSPGIDGMTVEQLPGYLVEHWPALRAQLLQGAYQPQPVKRVEIEKPGGGVRKLGVPTVLDRFLQQAVLQVLQRDWDRTFSPHSYGFRPHRSAQQAVVQAQQYVAEGSGWVVDLDLEKFLDAASYCSPFHGSWSKRPGCESITLIRRPLRRPRQRWMA